MPCGRLPGVGCRLYSVPCGNRLRREWSPPKCPETTRDGVGDPDGSSTKGPERRALELAEATGLRTERPRLMASACGGFGLLCWTGIRCGELLAHEMERGCKASGMKRIRIHDIRHSHVSLLIEMGFSALAIAERMGHEAVDITYRYAHLFPTKQDEMATALDGARG